MGQLLNKISKSDPVVAAAEADPDPVVAAEGAGPDPVVAVIRAVPNRKHQPYESESDSEFDSGYPNPYDSDSVDSASFSLNDLRSFLLYPFDDINAELEHPVGVRKLKSWTSKFYFHGADVKSCADNLDVETINVDCLLAMREILLIIKLAGSGSDDCCNQYRAYDRLLLLSRRINPKKSTKTPSASKACVVETLGNEDKVADPIPVEEEDVLCWWQDGLDKAMVSRDALTVMRDACLAIYRFQGGKGCISQILCAYIKIHKVLSQIKYIRLYDALNESLKAGKKGKQKSAKRAPVSKKAVWDIDERDIEARTWLNKYSLAMKSPEVRKDFFGMNWFV